MCNSLAVSAHDPFSPSSDKEQLIEEEDDELKEVLDLRKIAVQLLQQEQQNRWVVLASHSADVSFAAPFKSISFLFCFL